MGPWRALGRHKLHRGLLYDTRLQPQIAKTVRVRAECGLISENLGDLPFLHILIEQT